jgi:protein TonB
MYGKNERGVLEEVKIQSQTLPASGKPSDAGPDPGMWRTSRGPMISANLAAGMLENSAMKRPRRAINVFASVVGHTLLLAVAILLPLYFTGSIDLHQMETTYLVTPPLPPPPPPPPAAAMHAIRPPKSFFSNKKLYAPHAIPKHVAVVKDLSSAPQATAGMPGVIGGVPGGQLGGVIGGILGGVGHVAPPPPPKPATHRGPYQVGGRIQPPRLIDEVKPTYPAIAKAVRVQGDVVIDSVIDTHGDIAQMKLVSGSPLLVTAAFNAVRQWKYQPTLLNGVPVAVEMEVTVHFNLAS